MIIIKYMNFTQSHLILTWWRNPTDANKKRNQVVIGVWTEAVPPVFSIHKIQDKKHSVDFREMCLSHIIEHRGATSHYPNQSWWRLKSAILLQWYQVSAMSQIIDNQIVCSTACSANQQWKHQSSHYSPFPGNHRWIPLARNQYCRKRFLSMSSCFCITRSRRLYPYRLLGESNVINRSTLYHLLRYQPTGQCKFCIK